ncbi:MAG: hypothetical protein JW910_23795 [Anaerolineae bacterium]|nr:hypothetical protein [Anaerolineae bacterium]
MHMYRLAGSHYAIGNEYGALLRAERFMLPEASAHKIHYAAKCANVLAHHAPYLLDEIQGIIDGGQYPADRLKAYALTLNAHVCSVLALAGAHTDDGRPRLGRNFDWFRGVRQHSALIAAHVPDALTHVGANDYFVGRHGGINEAGLALGATAVPGKRDRVGIIFSLAIRAALDRCRTTDEAVAWLQDVPHVRNVNFLIVDAAGTIAVVEAAPQRVHSWQPEEGFAAITNQFQSEPLRSYDNIKRRPQDSEQRLARLNAWFARRSGPVSTQEVQAILARRYPGGVCAQGRSRRFGTMWSWVATPGERAIHFADGSPAEKPYRRYDF